MSVPQVVTAVIARLVPVWKSLVATDLLYKVLAFVLLTPLTSLVWRSVLSWRGQSALSDVDIAMFFAAPVGWLCAIGLGAIALAVIGLEQASLLTVLAADSAGKKATAVGAVRFAAAGFDEIIRVTLRIVGIMLLVLAPFLLLAAGVYFLLLGEYDINYYLNEKPTEFRMAVGAGAILVLVLIGIYVRLASGWLIALPLAMFDQIAPKEALKRSGQILNGHRKTVVTWILVWGAAVLAGNLLVTGMIGWIGSLLIPESINSVSVLVWRIGLLLCLLTATNLVISLFAIISFSALLFHCYQCFHGESEAAIAARLAEFEESTAQKSRLFTKGRLASVAIIGILASAVVGYLALNTVSPQDNVQVMAHRGASKAAPENTMAAFQQAIKDGADWIEIDVQETADGEVVVLHDSDLMKMAGNPLKIWNANYEDLADIDIGSWIDPKFSNQRVATLSQVLLLCKNKVGVNIELKYYGHDVRLEQQVIDIVEAEGMQDQVMIMSLKPEGIKKAEKLRPDWKFGLLLSVHVGDLKNLPGDFLAVNSRFASRNFVKRAHAVGKEVYVWTVNDAATMSQMINRQVDALLTDKPALANQVLEERQQLSTAERLLSELSLLFSTAAHNETAQP